MTQQFRHVGLTEIVPDGDTLETPPKKATARDQDARSPRDVGEDEPHTPRVDEDVGGDRAAPRFASVGQSPNIGPGTLTRNLEGRNPRDIGEDEPKTEGRNSSCQSPRLGS